MNQSFFAKIVCPFDKQDLILRTISTTGDDVSEGLLICSSCKRYFPIVAGIPIMSPDEYREVSLEAPLLEKWGEKPALTGASPTFRLDEKDSSALNEANERNRSNR